MAAILMSEQWLAECPSQVNITLFRVTLAEMAGLRQNKRLVILWKCDTYADRMIARVKLKKTLLNVLDRSLSLLQGLSSFSILRAEYRITKLNKSKAFVI